MGAHVLLNLLNKMGKDIKCQAWRAFVSLFRSEFNNLNNTGAWMLEYIYHMMKSNFWRNFFYFCHYVRNDVMDVITFSETL